MPPRPHLFLPFTAPHPCCIRKREPGHQPLSSGSSPHPHPPHTHQLFPATLDPAPTFQLAFKNLRSFLPGICPLRPCIIFFGAYLKYSSFLQLSLCSPSTSKRALIDLNSPRTSCFSDSAYLIWPCIIDSYTCQFLLYFRYLVCTISMLPSNDRIREWYLLNKAYSEN